MIRPIFDSHLDLAWNAASFNRDLTLSVDEIRRLEAGMTDEPSRGKNTLTLPELRKAGVRVCVATLLARSGPVPKRPSAGGNFGFGAEAAPGSEGGGGGWKRSDLDFASQSIAYAAASGQLAYYQLLEQQGHLRFLRTAGDLAAHWKLAAKEPGAPLGIILSMEGADPITTPKQVQQWWDLGLRAIGPAHYGRSHYAYGTGVVGPLSSAGIELLAEMSRLGMILDVTHLCDQSMAEALDRFDGAVLASHHNCRALVPADRQLTDEQIKRLVARGAVIGVALDAWMLYAGFERHKTSTQVLSLENVVDHIDHVCQLAGNAQHSAIGSDLDGGFGIEQTPHDLNTIADLQKLSGILAARGYPEADIDLIFHGNWLRFFLGALPE